MKNKTKRAAITAAQALIDANLSPFGREMSVRIAAHLQYVEGYFRDYRNELMTAVQNTPVDEALPLLLGDEWDKLSRSQKRQWVALVQGEMTATITFVQNFQRAITAQTTMIEHADSLRVEAETTRLAALEPANQPQTVTER